MASRPSVAEAGIAGSFHDFSLDPIAAAAGWQGTCGVCHVPHFAQDPVGLWARPLTQERTVLLQADNPKYLAGVTIVCYDCHDDNATTISPALDNDPLKTSWRTNEEPQDIAFGYNASGPGDTFAQGDTTKVGYYELFDGRMAPQDAAGPVDGSATGGHYWKRANNLLTGTPVVEQGDKIDCALCHDPHKRLTGTNEAFFRTETVDGGGGVIVLGDALKASAKTDVTNLNRSRNGTGTGREMCAACHGYADSGAPKVLWGNPVVAPPPTLAQHTLADNTACVKCHQHNRVSASCRECHGFPPLNAQPFNRVTNPDGQSAAYTGVSGAGAHQRHKDALGDLVFSCEICHGPGAGSATWHNQGAGTVTPANVDIMGRLDFWGAGSSYTGTNPAAGPANYAFAAKGGGDQRCSGLACHGQPPNVAGALNWTDNMVDGDGWRPLDGNPEGGAGVFVGDGKNVCTWCHDATPARLGTGPWAPNVMGNGTSWGAEVNGHGLPATSQYDKSAVGTPDSGRNGAAKDCAVCHDARYRVNPTPPPANTPWKTHFDGLNDSAQKRLKGTDGTTINGQSPGTADAVCVACHQTTGSDQGSQLSHHGNDTTGGYKNPLEPSFVRTCRQCHDVHGANFNGAGRNLNMVGRWIDADNDGVADAGEVARVDSDGSGSITAADRAVVFTSRTGADSFDENEGAYNAANDADDICATCHAPVTGGVGTGGGLHNGTASSFDMRGRDCTECHDHEFETPPVPSTPDAFVPSGCEGCHGKDCLVAPGAPNVMTINCPNGISVWDGTWWDSTQGGNDTTQQGGHGDPDGREGGNAALTPTCLSCHDTSVPPGTHLDGVYNSAGMELGGSPRPKGNANANTSHLLPAFFTEFPANGPGAWSAQVAMDNYCYMKCHASNSVQDMRHERDTQPPDAAHGSLELGTHLTRTAPLTYVMDADLNTTVSGLPNYVPCVACHNPHGSVNTDSKGSGPAAKNHMLIDDWQGDSTLCGNCHQ